MGCYIGLYHCVLLSSVQAVSACEPGGVMYVFVHNAMETDIACGVIVGMR